MRAARGVLRRLAAAEGSATAEFAVVLPAVVVVLALCLGSVAASAQYVRLVDAAADGARSAARGDDAAVPVGRIDAGASVAVAEEGGLVCVSVAASLRPLPAVTVPVAVRSCALGGGQ
ncbi:TadE family protein [Rathayibacter sp. VKM Ac-2803]|uniref:TadE family type IV pilus minor pilin n=1 Tax=unclassified Rathayibacter TaxID=2609250 RepID=UPI00135CC4E4|nr:MULTISPECIES: TadE family type IV pilus minor pilin [unclassified Rathayibacter]MWV49235.1 TadE family protein [Rathayibacter sp. VKM Ac-2803]MWV60015.1 TadE family protein [Rathayibacter sp. VKM Ac-2754]